MAEAPHDVEPDNQVEFEEKQIESETEQTKKQNIPQAIHDDEQPVTVKIQLSPKSDPYPAVRELPQDVERLLPKTSHQSNATSRMMSSLTTCLMNEIQSSRIDYSLLRELNNKSALEYIEMTQRANLLLQSMEVMNQQENQLMSQLTKIDDLVEEVNKLDSVVRKLDEYTKNLHAQFHKLYSNK